MTDATIDYAIAAIRAEGGGDSNMGIALMLENERRSRSGQPPATLRDLMGTQGPTRPMPAIPPAMPITGGSTPPSGGSTPPPGGDPLRGALDRRRRPQ